MIIGIVLLIGAMVYFYVSQKVIQTRLEPELDITTSEIPNELQPVYAYIQGCITQTAKEGLELLGARGGIVNPGIRGMQAGYSMPTEGAAVMFATNWLIPYWYHLSSDNDQQPYDFSIIPQQSLYLRKQDAPIGAISIEKELEEYVNENLRYCTGAFEELQQQGFNIRPSGSLTTRAVIREGDTLIAVRYPLQIAKAGTSTLSLFTTRIPLDLQRIYNLAVYLTNLEQQDHYLEKHALNLIALFSKIDSNKLPPQSDSRIKFGDFEVWQESRVKQQLKEILTAYTQPLRVERTLNYEPFSFDNDLDSALYNRGMTIPNNESFDLEVEFAYLDWEPYLDLDCEGGLCKPDSMYAEMLALIGVQIYEFSYDLSFPVMVTVRDPSAFLGEGYSFNFFLESNIRNNVPLETGFSPIQAATLSESSMLCDPNKRNSGNITIRIRDGLTNNPLEDVQAVYSCGGESCFLGGTNNEGKLVTKFPVCIGGILDFMKQDYVGHSRLYTTRLNRQDTLDFEMEPVLVKDVEIKKAVSEKTSLGFVMNYDSTSDPLPLNEDEVAYVVMTRKKGEHDQSYTTIVELRANETKEMKIAPGEYEMRIDLMYDNTIRIPESQIEVEGDTHTIEEQVFEDGFPNGGLYCTHVLFTDVGLDNSNNITFIAWSPDIPGIPESDRDITDLEQIGKVQETSEQFCHSLHPRFNQ